MRRISGLSLKEHALSSLGNGTIGAFNKIVENTLTKVYNMYRNDWYMHTPVVLWAYRIMCKKLRGQTSFRLVYGIEALLAMEYIISSFQITSLIDMADHETIKDCLTQLLELEEDMFLAGFHQLVQNEREKGRHGQHIKLCTFKVNDLVFLYDRIFTKLPGKFQMHSLGPYVVKEIIDGGAVQLAKLNGQFFLGKSNGIFLNLYQRDPTPLQ